MIDEFKKFIMRGNVVDMATGVIIGFDDKDTLTFDNLDFKASFKNDAVTFNVSGGSVTLKDFVASTFHINGDVYRISGSKFVKK